MMDCWFLYQNENFSIEFTLYKVGSNIITYDYLMVVIFWGFFMPYYIFFFVWVVLYQIIQNTLGLSVFIPDYIYWAIFMIPIPNYIQSFMFRWFYTRLYMVGYFRAFSAQFHITLWVWAVLYLISCSRLFRGSFLTHLHIRLSLQIVLYSIIYMFLKYTSFYIC